MPVFFGAGKHSPLFLDHHELLYLCFIFHAIPQLPIISNSPLVNNTTNNHKTFFLLLQISLPSSNSCFYPPFISDEVEPVVDLEGKVENFFLLHNLIAWLNIDDICV